MPTKKDTPVDDKSSADNPDGGFRTGQNVDAGLEPGIVTVDPDTPQGRAAAAARKANGATTSTDDDGREIVDQPDAPYGPKAHGPGFAGSEQDVINHQTPEVPNTTGA